jgi:polysaccharide biosynthesis transport protein
MSMASLSPRPTGGNQFGDAESDLPALGAALWRNKWQIIRPTVLAALIAIAVVEMIPPKYQSEARVLIEGRDNVFLRPNADKDLIDRGTVDQEAVTSQVQLILSRDLAREVIEKLKLNELPEFDPAIAGISPLRKVLGVIGVIKNPMRMTPEERVLDAYYDRLQVFAVEKSRVIVIDFPSEDPKLAAEVANAIADAYLVRQQAAKQQQARAAGDWLAGEIESMRRKVADAEAKVEAFRANSNLLVGTNNTTLSAQSLGDVNAQLAASRAQKADAQSKAKLIREMLRAGGPLESSDILNSELIRRLSEQRVTLRAQLAEQSSTLLDAHPRIKELKAQIADLDKQIRVEADMLAHSLENDAKLADARVDMLSASLDQLKNQAAGTNEQDVQLRALERDAKSQRELLESYLAKYREATARDTINSAPADARVISRATVSTVPAYPKKLPTVLIASLAVMVLSSGWVLTRELLAAPVTATPRAARAGVRPRRRAAAVADAAGRFASLADHAPTAIGVPVTAIKQVAADVNGGGRPIAIFDAGRGLDTTGIAIKLARALAENGGRVVLVGLSSGSNDAIKATSSDPSVGGLAELAAGTASFSEIITKDKQSALNLITSGRTPTDRLAILSAPGMAPMFAALARSYDHLVLDAGALGGPEMAAIAEIAPHAFLLTESATGAATAAGRERLIDAGFDDVTVLVGARAGTAAAGAAAA